MRKVATSVVVVLLCAAASVVHAAPVCSSDGWCWSNPLPQGNSLYSAWGSASNDVWAVGEGGTILHWDGTAWSAFASGTGNYLYSVWGSASNDVWGVDDRGTILHWDGSGWSASSSITTDWKTVVWGRGSDDGGRGGNGSTM